jgi:hypothetical protein
MGSAKAVVPGKGWLATYTGWDALNGMASSAADISETGLLGEVGVAGAVPTGLLGEVGGAEGVDGGVWDAWGDVDAD